MGDPTLEIPSTREAQEERLDSWKEIAAYLDRDVTTVQRWEKREGMPVHRHLHAKRGSVYALPSELDSWRGTRNPVSPQDEISANPEIEQAVESSQDERSAGLLRFWPLVGAGVLAGLLIAAYFIFFRPQKNEGQLRIRSLAVLPLRNLSGDSSQDYLADGMTESLTDRLAGIRDLRVVSHTSVMQFKNPQVSVPEIAKALGVDALVEGSVIRDGSRIRVTAQLIRASTDEHFWSETYDRELRDALSLESELAQTIAKKVEATVTGQEQQRLQARPVSPEVYEIYLKGISAESNGTDRKKLNESIQDFEEAIHRDPEFAPAYVRLAEIYSAMGTVFAGNPPEQTRPKVISLARKALELDSDSADAHAVLANTLQEQFEWAEAETEYKRALELAPNNATARWQYALWLLCQGRTDEAIEEVKRARESDPLAVSGFDVSWILFQSRHFDEAIRESRSALAVQPNNPGGLTFLGFALLGNQQFADAIPVLEKAVALSHGSPAATGVLIRAYARSGRREDALRLLATLKKRQSEGYIPAAAFVNANLGLGNTEEAFLWLEKAYQEKSNILQFVKTHPFFDPIRSDPRFVDLVRRIGLG